LRILVVEDDGALRRFLERGLTAEGYRVGLAADGEAAMEELDRMLPDLVVMDLNLPKRDGTEVLRFLRERSEETPVLVLSARHEVGTRVECLDLGADDCMGKPFSLAELKARCRALLRRRGQGAKLVLRHRDLELNRVEHTVRRSGEDVALTRTEYALLECLMLHRGQPVSRASLLSEVWKESTENGTNIVDVYVNYLRRKLGEDGLTPLIQTVRGLGYAIGMAGSRREAMKQAVYPQV
jgi:DNA-binding response OmpR family regulator